MSPASSSLRVVQVRAALLEVRNFFVSLKLTLVYPSKEARDATLASGMDRGVAAGYDRLDEYFASLVVGGAERATK